MPEENPIAITPEVMKDWPAHVQGWLNDMIGQGITPYLVPSTTGQILIHIRIGPQREDYNRAPGEGVDESGF